MKNIFFVQFIMFSFILFFASCVSNETANSDTVKQSEIYQSYTVTYDSGDKELTATASFRFGGSTGTSLALTAPSKVLFNDQEMAADKNLFTGTFYEINKQITAQPLVFAFEYADNDKKSYKNSVAIDAIDIDSYPKSIMKNGEFEVSWLGSPLQNGESVSVTLEGKEFFSCTQNTSTVGATSVKFSKELLKDIKSGDADIVAKRTKSLSLKEASHLGGSITATYVSAKVGTTIQ